MAAGGDKAALSISFRLAPSDPHPIPALTILRPSIIATASNYFAAQPSLVLLDKNEAVILMKPCAPGRINSIQKV